MREDVIGRANVEDTPELEAYYSELGRQQSYALWTVANDIEPWQPQPTSLPTCGATRRCGRWCCRRSTWSAPKRPAAG